MDYRLLCRQIESLSGEAPDWLPVLAHASALLYHAMQDVNWAGFYLVRGDHLILGPFQGKVACVRIAKGKGVCGTAWQANAIQLVPDVHAFAGHIACDPESRSEIVLPVRRGGAPYIRAGRRRTQYRKDIRTRPYAALCREHVLHRSRS